MSREQMSDVAKPWRAVFLAGLAGGMAEVIWVAGYSAVSGGDGWQVAREVSAAISPAWAGLDAAPVIGLGIHFLLSVLLAGAFMITLWAPYLRCRGVVAVLIAGPIALAGVWAMNFLVVLPVVHPAFVQLLPYPVSLGSKILFGLAMSVALIVREISALPVKDGRRMTCA